MKTSDIQILVADNCHLSDPGHEIWADAAFSVIIEALEK